MKKFLFFAVLLAFAFRANAYHWTVNPNQYPNTMTAIAVIHIDGVEQMVNTLEVGAFCGDECRGREMPVYIEQMDRYYLFLTMYGVEGDQLTFRLYDHVLDQEFDGTCSNVESFVTNGTLGSPVSPYIFEFVSATVNYTITASVNPSNGGSVSGAGTYQSGSTCNLTATANTGYTFTNWTKNGTVVSSNPTYSFTVTEDASYVANFELSGYTITATANPAEGGTVTGAGNYNYGATCTLTATANTGYNFINWTKNGRVVSTNPTYSFTVTRNASYVANFELSGYIITATANPIEGGTVTGAGSYTEGSTCTLTATANTGYNFTNWMKNGTVVSTNPTYSFTVTEDASYVANFELSGYTITATANPVEGGTITGTGNYNYGATCTLTATTNTGYEFTNWTENGTEVSNNASYTFMVTGNRNLVANFTGVSGDYHWTVNPNQYPNTMTAIAVIQIDGVEQMVNTLEVGAFCGDECRGREMPVYIEQMGRYYLFLTMYGTEGDQLTFRLYDHVFNQEFDGTCSNVESFVTNGTLGSPVSPYIFEFVSATVNYTITASANPSNGGTVSGAGTYQSGSTCTLTATANTGYNFMNWMKNGTVVSTNPTYSFTVTEDASYVANFEAEVGMPGDANGDGTVNALDIVITVNYIFGATSIEFVFENADINGDGVVNALDLVAIVNLIFSKKS